MGRADFELANLELIQRNSTEETKIVWQTRVPQKVDPASIARFRSAVRGEYADTKLLIYGLFQKGQVLAQDGVRTAGSNRMRGELRAANFAPGSPSLDWTLSSTRANVR